MSKMADIDKYSQNNREFWQLVDKKNNPIALHSNVTDFRDKAWIIVGVRPPHKPSSQGHVSLCDPDTGNINEFYATVIGAKFVYVR